MKTILLLTFLLSFSLSLRLSPSPAVSSNEPSKQLTSPEPVIAKISAPVFDRMTAGPDSYNDNRETAGTPVVQNKNQLNHARDPLIANCQRAGEAKPSSAAALLGKLKKKQEESKQKEGEMKHLSRPFYVGKLPENSAYLPLHPNVLY